MRDDVSVRYRSIVLRYRDMIEDREHFCYTVTTPLTLDEAVRRIGVERRELVPADGVDTLAEEGYLLIGQYGQAVVTFDEAGVGRFLRDEALAKGCDRGVVQWDFYNLMLSYSSRDGGGSWDEELRDDEWSSEEMVAALREGPLAEYADLFHRYVEMERGDVDEEADPAYLQAVMLTVLEPRTGVRLDDGLIGGLPCAVRVPQSLR